MPNEQLVVHIRGELGRGVDKATLSKSLLTVGWKVEDINAAMVVVESAQAKNTPAPAPSYSSSVANSQSVPVIGSAMKTMVQDVASGLFIFCVFILTIVSILGVWKIFTNDVITKSFETLGLLAFVAVVVIVASKFVGDPTTIALSNPAFRTTRNITLGTLIVSSVLLAFFGVLSIWDVITDKDILNKSLSSLAIVAFSSLIIVMICLEREQNQFWKKHSGQMSGGMIFTVIIIVIWLFFSL